MIHLNDIIMSILCECDPVCVIKCSSINKQFYDISFSEILWYKIIKNINEDINWSLNKTTSRSNYIKYYQIKFKFLFR